MSMAPNQSGTETQNFNPVPRPMLLSVHDEIAFEVPPDELDTVKEVVQAEMEGVWDLSVPLKVNISHGGNWTEAH